MTLPRPRDLDTDILSWTAAHAVAAASATLKTLRDLGVRITGSDRLASARRLVDRVGAGFGDNKKTAPSRRQLEDAHRTILEQYLIVRTLAPSASLLGNRLQEMLSGADIPENDLDTKGRDIQFELLVAALLLLGGIAGVEVDEPDFRIKVGDRAIGVAAKRVSSRNQMTKRVRKAASQILRWQLPSVVFLLADWAELPTDAAARGKELRSRLDEHLPMLLPPKVDELCMGAFVLGTSWVWAAGDPTQLAGITVHGHAHMVAGPFAREVDTLLNQIGRNVRWAVAAAVAELDDEARRLVDEEQRHLRRRIE